MNVTHSGSDLPGDHFLMPAPVEEAAVAPPRAVSTASQKMLQLLRKRLRQLLWCILGLALAAGVFAIWWLTSLYGLPDIGDPFDVAAFKSYQIPDDQNGVVFFQQAFEKLTPLPEVPYAAKTAAATGSWSKLDPKLQRWVEANRPAIALLQQGADRSDVNWGSADEFFWHRFPMLNPGGLLWLALVEGGRRAETGDLAGAWDCYRAVLRTTTHLRRRGNMSLRHIVNIFHGHLRHRLADWAADPKTTIPQLRRALDEATLSQPKPEWDVVSLKLEYLHLMRSLEQPRYSLHRAIDEDVTYRIGDYQVPDDLAMYLFLGDASSSASRNVASGQSGCSSPTGLPILRGPIRGKRVRPSGSRSRRRIAPTSCRSIPSAPRRRPAPAAPRPATWQAGSSRPRMPSPSYGWVSGHPFLIRNEGDIASWSSCSPKNSIAATTGCFHLPTMPCWERIFRPCPTTVRPSPATEQRRSCPIEPWCAGVPHSSPWLGIDLTWKAP